MNSVALRIGRPFGDGRLVCRFVHQLTVRSGVTVAARRVADQQWQIVWSDGPAVLSMRRFAADLGPAVVGVDLDQLIWKRTTRAHAQPRQTGLSNLDPASIGCSEQLLPDDVQRGR